MEGLSTAEIQAPHQALDEAAAQGGASSTGTGDGKHLPDHFDQQPARGPGDVAGHLHDPALRRLGTAQQGRLHVLRRRRADLGALFCT